MIKRISYQNDAVTVGELEAAIINEDPIVEFLGQVPGMVLKMNQLGIGEFTFRGDMIVKNPTKSTFENLS